MASVIENESVVGIEYRLSDSDGNLIDSSEGSDPLAYLHGAQNILPALESELTGKSVGDKVSTVIQPENGYGVRNDTLVGEVPRADLEGIPNVEIGMELEAETPEGARIVRVIAMSDDSITIDANHPLAGVELHFDVTVASIREATEEEISHGHVHGPGGHSD